MSESALLLADMADEKHVIFLGAGASKSSGYPLARDLTKLMADRTHFFEYVEKLLSRRDPALLTSQDQEETQRQSVINTVLPIFQSFQPAARLLKEGSFATMDELSNLAFGGERSGDVLQLKKLLRLIFALDTRTAGIGAVPTTQTSLTRFS